MYGQHVNTDGWKGLEMDKWINGSVWYYLTLALYKLHIRTNMMMQWCPPGRVGYCRLYTILYRTCAEDCSIFYFLFKIKQLLSILYYDTKHNEDLTNIQWRRQLLGTEARTPSTSNNFIFSSLWSAFGSQLSNDCSVCELSWCRCQQLMNVCDDVWVSVLLPLCMYGCLCAFIF